MRGGVTAALAVTLAVGCAPATPPSGSNTADEVPVVTTDASKPQPESVAKKEPPREPTGVISAIKDVFGEGKISKCNRLIEVINREQGPLKNTSGSDLAALRKLGDTLDGVAERVTAVRDLDDELSRRRDEYASMAKDLAKASRDTAAALEGNDPGESGRSGQDDVELRRARERRRLGHQRLLLG